MANMVDLAPELASDFLDRHVAEVVGPEVPGLKVRIRNGVPVAVDHPGSMRTRNVGEDETRTIRSFCGKSLKLIELPLDPFPLHARKEVLLRRAQPCGKQRRPDQAHLEVVDLTAIEKSVYG